MNDLQIFENSQFGSIRTVTRDGEPWFVAKDVCEALELGNSRQALVRLDDDEKDVISTDTPGGVQEVSIVNEPGLYTLILGSRKPEAKAFKRWVTHDILPAIRKTGRYAAPGAMTNTLAEMHSAMGVLSGLLEEMQQVIPKNSALARALTAQSAGTLEVRHLGSGNNSARVLLDRDKIGRKITIYMIEEDLTSEELAAALGVSSMTISRWKNGQNAPAAARLEKLCELLGCDVTDLLR